MNERTEHTPGRIRYYENGEANSYALLEVDADDRWLLTLLHNGTDVTERQIANMRRLAACWNACEGIKTGILESVTLVGDTLLKRFAGRDKIELELTTQRDELLAALKTAKWMLERDYIDDQKMAVINKCDDAIAKATGEEE